MSINRNIIIKCIDEKYLEQTKLTPTEIAQQISDMTEKTVNTIKIISAGWDAMFGNYAVLRACNNRLWIASNGEVIEDNGWSKERLL